MANYTNLTDLTGLAVGDKITYNSTTSINLAGYTVSGVMYGYRYGSGNTGYGGKVEFELDSSKLSDKNITFNVIDSTGVCICAGTSNSDLYYRIVVAGSGGYASATSPFSATKGGNGGGLAGTAGASNGGAGGTQISGANFGNGSSASSTYTYSSGGYGWYGGYAGSITNAKRKGGGGGSSFVIGKTTTTYPSGYLGDDAALIAEYEGAFNSGSTTTGSSTTTTSSNHGTLTLTIVAPAEPIISSTIKRYNGSSWDECYIKYYDGNNFIQCNAKRYDGSNWVDL